MTASAWIVAIASAVAPLLAQRGEQPLAGRVLDERGEPLAGVAVCLVRDESYVTAEIAAEPLAVTGADGRYAATLPGGDAMPPWLLFVGKGRVHVRTQLRPHDGWPIVLPKDCMLIGRVVDADGKPVVGVRVEARDWLRSARYRANADLDWLPEPRTAVCTDEAGMFRMPGTCRAGVSLVTGDGRGQVGSMPVAFGDPIELVHEPPVVEPLRPPVARKPAPTIAVRALAPDGAPLPTFRCAAVRSDEAWLTPQVRRSFEDAATPSVDGAGQPAMRGARSGTVCIVAEADGMATACVPIDAGTAEVTVQFRREATLAGTVVDGSGAPVAGAKLWVFHGAPNRGIEVEWWDGEHVDRFDPGRGHAVSDANGAFVVQHVRGGQQYLACTAPGCVIPFPLEVAPAAGGSLRDLKIVVTRHPSIAGITGLAPVPLHGASIRLVRDDQARAAGMAWLGPSHGSRWSNFEGGAPIAPDGSFHLPAIPAGSYAIELVLARPLRHGAPDVLAVGSTVVEAGTTSLALDLRGHLPARVHGKVRGPVPSGRMLVGVSRADSGSVPRAFACYECPLAPVAPDGSFELRTPPGECTVFAIDAWTGVVLHRQEPRTVAANADVAIDCEVVAAAVDVQLRGVEQRQAWLELVVPPPAFPDGIDGAKVFAHEYSRCLGCLVGPRSSDLRLWFPPVEGRMQLVDGDGRNLPKSAHTEAEFAAVAGKTGAVKLEFPR